MNIFRGYIVFIGLDQDYSMFAPEPRKKNRNLFVLITFHDQSTAIWSYPRMERFKCWQSMLKERYRKFGNDNIVESCFKIFLPDFARYIARLHTCLDNEPEIVTIYLHEEDIVYPTASRGCDKEIQAVPRLINLFTYRVKSTDLQGQ
jgi:hypothetical protein